MLASLRCWYQQLNAPGKHSDVHESTKMSVLKGQGHIFIFYLYFDAWMLRRFRHKDLVERFCGRCCPKVQLSLKAQSGFDVSFLVRWMGTVGREKEHSILHLTAWTATRLTLHQKNWALACQPGWEWERKLGMWLVSDASWTFWIPKGQRLRIRERM